MLTFDLMTPLEIPGSGLHVEGTRSLGALTFSTRTVVRWIYNRSAVPLHVGLMEFPSRAI